MAASGKRDAMDGFSAMIAASFHRVITPLNIAASTDRDNTNDGDDDALKLAKLYTYTSVYAIAVIRHAQYGCQVCMNDAYRYKSSDHHRELRNIWIVGDRSIVKRRITANELKRIRRVK